MTQPKVKLADGNIMPQLGLVSGEQAVRTR